MAKDATHSVLIKDLAEGGMIVCTHETTEIVVCRTKDGIYALQNLCTHADARLSEGRLRGNRLICPLHGAAFDVRDGRVLGAPATSPLVCYPVHVVGEQIEVRTQGAKQT